MREGWDEKRFDEVFSLQMGKTPDRKNFSLFEGDNIWVSIKDLEDKYISSSKECISDEAASNINIVKSGTVIMSFKLTIGKCAIAATDLYTNEAIMAFNTNDGYEIDSSFLYYYLQGYEWEGLNNAVMGLTLNKSTISKHKISFPTILIQQAIASELDMITEMISKYDEQLKELDKLSQSIFYEMFGDPVENEKGWEVKKLEEIADATIGLTYKPENVADNGVIVLRSGNIQNSALDFTDILRVETNIPSHKYVKDGDILMCTRNGSLRHVGKVAIIKNLNEQMTYGAFMTVIRSEMNPYLYGYFNTPAFRDSLIHGKTTTINQITVKMLNETSLPIPPLPLQQSFARNTEAIEAMKSKVREAKKEAETLLAARMQYWFE